MVAAVAAWTADGCADGGDVPGMVSIFSIFSVGGSLSARLDGAAAVVSAQNAPLTAARRIWYNSPRLRGR